MWRMYCVCLLSVIVVLDLLGQSHVNRTPAFMIQTEANNIEPKMHYAHTVD